jgi:HSP20 family protein
MNELMRRTGLDPLFDDMLKGFFVRPLAFDSDTTPGIKLDVKEDDKAYTVHAELPGVKKEDIHVQVDGNRVSLSAEIKRESEQREGEKVLRTERYFGQVSRSFQLAQDIDEGGAQAEFSDGVLKLVLPKKDKPTSRRIAIK